MQDYLIITNNPTVKEEIEEVEIDFFQTLDQVVIETRNLIHNGYELVTHPLSGSVKPVQNPYKSIILSTGDGRLNYKSLEIIENTIAKIEQFKKDHVDRDYPESVKEDYQLIDFSLLKSGVKNLKKGGE